MSNRNIIAVAAGRPTRGASPCTSSPGARDALRCTLWVAGIAIILASSLCAAPLWAGEFPPERRFRFENRAENQYLIIPAIASLPGIGVFVAVIVSASNLAGTGVELAAAYAESIDNTDIKIRAVALREIPLHTSRILTLDYQYAELDIGNFQTFLPGRNSPNFTIPVTAQFVFQQLRPTLNLFDRRLKASYTLGFIDGFEFDEDGNELGSARHSSGFDISLDLTDSEVNPKVGVFASFSTSLDAPESTPFGRNSIPTDLRREVLGIIQREYNLSAYLPVGDSLVLVGNLQYFRTLGGDRGSGIVPGGSPPLRGYPAGRWSDRFGAFFGSEVRYNIPYNDTISVILARGYLEEFQIVAFYELGQVSPKENESLFENMHESYGGGARLAFDSIVLRFDLGLSDEGAETHLTINQHF